MRDLLAAELDGTNPAAIDDADDLEWRVFYETAESRDAARATLGPFALAHGLTTGSLEVEDEDWARRSQAQLTAVRIGGLIVAPPWDRATAAHLSGAIEIVIEPSVGFGTGHHASTRLCLAAMQQLDLRGASVIDVGTGSGVLAIAAAKLGAASVIAIDTDRDAIANARDNAARNGADVRFFVADVADPGRSYMRDMPPSTAFDVVLANLTAAWLRRLSVPLLTLAAVGGTLILSGIQTSEKDRVLEAFEPSVEDRTVGPARALEEDGWSALVLAVRDLSH